MHTAVAYVPSTLFNATHAIPTPPPLPRSVLSGSHHLACVSCPSWHTVTRPLVTSSLPQTSMTRSVPCPSRVQSQRDATSRFKPPPCVAYVCSSPCQVGTRLSSRSLSTPPHQFDPTPDVAYVSQPPRPSVTRRPRFDSRRVSHMCHRPPAHRDATFYSERVRHAHPIRLPTECRVCVPPPSGPLMEKAVTNPTCPPASGGHHCGAPPPLPKRIPQLLPDRILGSCQ